MKLRDAFLCVTCEEIHESARVCPSCGSAAPALAIARVIKPMPREELLPTASQEASK